MGRLCIAAVESNYQEVDRQLKEQFIHGLNDKHMLEEIIKEPTVTNNDDHITSGGILAWVKRVETQRVWAVVLNTLTELRQFDKKSIEKGKGNTARAMVGWMPQWQPCQYCGRVHPPRQCLAYGKMCVGVARWDISRKYATAKEVGQ